MTDRQVPCRVSAEELQHDRSRISDLADAAIRERARDDLLHDILAGRSTEFNLTDVLDCALNDRYSVNLADIAALLSKICTTGGDDRILAAGNLDTWTRKLVADFITPEMIEERVEEMDADAEADR